MLSVYRRHRARSFVSKRLNDLCSEKFVLSASSAAFVCCFNARDFALTSYDSNRKRRLSSTENV